MPKDTKDSENLKARVQSSSEEANAPAVSKTEPAAKAKTKTQKLQGIKSRDRVRDAGEVFTQPREVNAMCDLCEPIISDINKKVLEPSCGNGNFLVEILRRKLKNAGKDQYKILIALSNIYGVDIAKDNLEEARTRMKNIILDHLKGEPTPAAFLMSVNAILEANICYGNMLTGRHRINVIEWTPDGEGGFEIEKWTIKELEERRAKIRQINNLLELPQITHELLHSPLEIKKKAKPKPKPEPVEQIGLFK